MVIAFRSVPDPVGEALRYDAAASRARRGARLLCPLGARASRGCDNVPLAADDPCGVGAGDPADRPRHQHAVAAALSSAAGSRGRRDGRRPMSGGRLRLGVSAGYSATDLRAFAVPEAERARRMRDGLALIRAVWTSEHVNL